MSKDGKKLTAKLYDCVGLCQEFHLLSSAIRDCTRRLRDQQCPNEIEAEYDEQDRCTYPGGDSCLSKFFSAVSIGDGETQCFAAMCSVCTAKLDDINKRRELRRKFAGLKRRIANAGRLHDGSALEVSRGTR